MTKTPTLIATVVLVLIAGAASAQKAAATAAPAPVATPAAAAGTAAMRPGLWEITVSNQAAGAEERRTIVSRYCFSATDISDVARTLPRQREPGMKCENRDVRPQAGKVSWQVACSAPDGTLGGPAEAAFEAKSYAGKAELEHKKKGAKAEKVTSTLSGKWVEPCK